MPNVVLTILKTLLRHGLIIHFEMINNYRRNASAIATIIKSIS